MSYWTSCALCGRVLVTLLVSKESIAIIIKIIPYINAVKCKMGLLKINEIKICM